MPQCIRKGQRTAWDRFSLSTKRGSKVLGLGNKCPFLLSHLTSLIYILFSKFSYFLCVCVWDMCVCTCMGAMTSLCMCVYMCAHTTACVLVHVCMCVTMPWYECACVCPCRGICMCACVCLCHGICVCLCHGMCVERRGQFCKVRSLSTFTLNPGISWWQSITTSTFLLWAILPTLTYILKLELELYYMLYFASHFQNLGFYHEYFLS